MTRTLLFGQILLDVVPGARLAGEATFLFENFLRWRVLEHLHHSGVRVEDAIVAESVGSFLKSHQPLDAVGRRYLWPDFVWIGHHIVDVLGVENRTVLMGELAEPWLVECALDLVVDAGDMEVRKHLHVFTVGTLVDTRGTFLRHL